MLNAKIHHACVTETNLDYEGSLSLDEDLMKAAEMLPYEKVHIYNVSNGERFSTYLIKGEKGSGKVGVYGASAYKAGLGDKLIIVSYVFLDEEEVDFFRPKVLILGDGNQVVEVK